MSGSSSSGCYASIATLQTACANITKLIMMDGDLFEERLDMKDPYREWIQMYCDEKEDRSIAERKRRDAEELRRLGPVGA